MTKIRRVELFCMDAADHEALHQTRLDLLGWLSNMHMPKAVLHAYTDMQARSALCFRWPLRPAGVITGYGAFSLRPPICCARSACHMERANEQSWAFRLPLARACSEIGKRGMEATDRSPNIYNISWSVTV